MTGSSQDQPNAAVAARPIRTAAACAAQRMFWTPSPEVANDWSVSPRRRLTTPRTGMSSRLAAVTAMPRPLVAD